MIKEGEVIMVKPEYEQPDPEVEARRNGEAYRVLRIVSKNVVLCRKLKGGYRESFSMFALWQSGLVSKALFQNTMSTQTECCRGGKWEY